MTSLPSIDSSWNITPLSPTPQSPTPLSLTPLSLTPQSPTPLSPTPLSPTPLSPTPLNPTKIKVPHSGNIQGHTTTLLSPSSPPHLRHESLFTRLETSTKIFSFFQNSLSPRTSSERSEEVYPVLNQWQGNLIKPYNDLEFLEELIKFDNAELLGGSIQIFSFIKDLRKGIDDFKIVAHQRELDHLVDKTLIKFKHNYNPDYEGDLKKHYTNIKFDYFFVENRKEDLAPKLLNSTESDKKRCKALIDDVLQQTSIRLTDVENLNKSLIAAVNGFSDLWRFSISFHEYKNQQSINEK